MRGLELSKAYFETYGRPMLAQFPAIAPLVAAGLTGAGSECFGFDDEFSKDHDFEPGFCLFLPGEDKVSSREEFALERAYAKLPKEFGGCRRQNFAPSGCARKGVVRAADHWRSVTGAPDGKLDLQQWLTIPQHYLAQAVNGEIFYDPSGFFTKIRSELSDMPDDVAKKRVCGHLYLAAQAGDYNYPRCLLRGDKGAAKLCLNRFLDHACAALFLMKKKYMPFYKWQFRALRELYGEALAKQAEGLLCAEAGSGEEARLQHDLSAFLIRTAMETYSLSQIEKTAAHPFVRGNGGALPQQDASAQENGPDLARTALLVGDSIRDPYLRNLDPLAAV